MPKIDPKAVSISIGSNYPLELGIPCSGRVTQRLGDAGGLTQFGANHVTLPPALSAGETWASQRHYHSAEDEFIYILSGSPILIDNNGEVQLLPGDSCAHPAGDGNGHHLVNRTNSAVTFLVVGTRKPQIDHCQYPDVDLDLPPGEMPERPWHHKNGSPYIK